MNTKSIIATLRLAFVISVFLHLNSCSDNIEENPALKNGLTRVMDDNDNWTKLGTIQSDREVGSNAHFYSIDIGGFSIEPSNQLNFFLTESIQTADELNTNYFIANYDMINNIEFRNAQSDRQFNKKYFFKPGTGEVLESGDGSLFGQSINYQNTHSLAGSYSNGYTNVDAHDNVITASAGNGVEQWLFMRRSGTSVDSFYSATSTFEKYSGFFPAVLKNEQLYAIAKKGKSVVAFKQDASTYTNGKGELKEIGTIPCSSFYDEVNAKYQARVSNDGRYIYYWLCETFFKPTRGWYFVFDVENETFKQVFDFIALNKGATLSTTGKSRLASIGDDGSLYIAGFEDPDLDDGVCIIYKMDVNLPSKVSAQYKAENFLIKDAKGKAYEVNYLQHINGKLIFGVPSNNADGNPQMDIFMEK